MPYIDFVKKKLFTSACMSSPIETISRLQYVFLSAKILKKILKFIKFTNSNKYQNKNTHICSVKNQIMSYNNIFVTDIELRNFRTLPKICLANLTNIINMSVRTRDKKTQVYTSFQIPKAKVTPYVYLHVVYFCKR